MVNSITSLIYCILECVVTEIHWGKIIRLKSCVMNEERLAQYAPSATPSPQIFIASVIIAVLLLVLIVVLACFCLKTHRHNDLHTHPSSIDSSYIKPYESPKQRPLPYLFAYHPSFIDLSDEI